MFSKEITAVKMRFKYCVTIIKFYLQKYLAEVDKHFEYWLSKFMWVKREHMLHKEMEEARKHLDPKLFESIYSKMPEWQWIWKEYSIISPSKISFGHWEVMDGTDGEIERFETFNESKQWCEARHRFNNQHQ